MVSVGVSRMGKINALNEVGVKVNSEYYCEHAFGLGLLHACSRHNKR